MFVEAGGGVPVVSVGAGRSVCVLLASSVTAGVGVADALGCVAVSCGTLEVALLLGAASDGDNFSPLWMVIEGMVFE
jgi:hypothetical protein